MDKSWINELRSSRAYLDGVASFIKFACESGLIGGKIFCPCKRCYNKHCLDPEVVEEHLLWNGFSRGYTTWVFHGESVPQPQFIACETHAESLEQSPLGTYLHPHRFTNSNTTRVEEGITRQEELRQLVRDACGVHESNLNEEPSGDATILEPTFEAGNNDTEQFRKLMEGCDEPLFLGCRKHSKVSFLVTLYHLKISHSWSGKSFTELLETLAEIFPEGTAFPSSYYDAKKLLKALDLSYEKIHACPNDCMLFQGDEHSEVCKICGSSRWASNEDEDNGVITNMNVTPANMDTTTKKRRPAKVLRYFPLIPRLKRLYMSSKTASSMSWHQHGRIKDGKLRHPADALAWKKFDERYPDFVADPRNIRLGLASDGFNPYRTMSTTYSTWPVILMPYNLEPWVCMKRSSIMLSMIIPGEKGPGNDIDVFLQPLIAELIQLWKGVEAFDTSTGQNFNLRAALLWTINDFPAYANLSGWSTKGRYACPSCADSTHSQWLFHGGKFCYMGHRRWLDSNHEFRHQKDHFDGTLELRPPPIPPSGPEVFAQVQRLNHIYGKPNKLSKKRGRDQGYTIANACIGAETNIAQQDTIFDDDDDLIEDDDNFDLDGEGRTRVKRGIARAKDVWSLPEGEKILVAVNELGQPIEKPGGILGSWLGTVARQGNLCPLNYISWRKVPHTLKKNLINLTLTKFVIPLDNRRTEKWILTSISSKWKDYKYDLKKEYFVEGKSQEEIASNVPPGIYSPQWVDLVNYWFSEKSRRYSDIGKAARANQSTPHTSGTRSFARAEDLFVKKNGRQPRRIEWYSITHRHENGTYISEKCQQFVDEANALVKERVNAAEYPDEYLIEEEVFNELMGEDRYGRVKGYGLGVSASDLRMVQTTSRAEEQLELEFLRREIANEKALREEENQKMQKLLELRDREHQVELQDLRDQMRLLTATVLQGSGGTGSFMPST